MNGDMAEGQWMQMKGKLREKWGNLTDSDLEKVQGQRERFAGLMQERYGMRKEEAEKEWENLPR